VASALHDPELSAGFTAGCPLEDRPEWSVWVTPRRLMTEPVHRWFVFPHSFSPQLVRSLIREWGLAGEDVILDPFVGAGTTLLAAQDAGLGASGFDLSPLSELASRVKVAPPDAAALRSAWAAVKPRIRVRRRLSAQASYGDLVVRAFPEAMLPTLDGARRAILEADQPDAERDALLLALLAVLPAFSLLVRKGGWLEERAECLPPDRVRRELEARVQLMADDLKDRRCGGRPRVTVSIGDARWLPLENESISAVVTSPPYPNRHDYTRVFGVELQFGFLDWNGLRQLRYQSFSSHPESKPERAKDNGYAATDELGQTIAKIGDLITERRAKTRIPQMLHGYFEDVYLALQEIRRVLRSGGTAAVVLGNVSYCGIPLEVDRFAVEISRQLGLEPRVIYVARRRGNSAQQMKDHGRRPQRESVVILDKPVPARHRGHTMSVG
jgi:DNA modification methylase